MGSEDKVLAPSQNVKTPGQRTDASPKSHPKLALGGLSLAFILSTAILAILFSPQYSSYFPLSSVSVRPTALF